MGDCNKYYFYLKTPYKTRILYEKKSEMFKKNMPSDLHGADAKYEFIMVRIADNIRLICCKSVQKDKILPAIYVLDFRVNVNQ